MVAPLPTPEYDPRLFALRFRFFQAMVQRILAGILAALVVAALAGAVVGWINRAELLFVLTSPRLHYGDMDRMTLPIYLFPAQWAAHIVKADSADLVPPGVTSDQSLAKADVFFITGSSYFGYLWNAPFNEPNAATIIDGPLLALDASAFNGCCRVFAPRYRQAHYAAIERSTADGRSALELAFTDIVRAWDSYVMEENKGRPVILVGHDQGAVHLMRLLDLRIEPKTRIAERMVAAYVIGAGVPRKRFGTNFKNITACQTATDLFCVVAWETYVDGTDPSAHPNTNEVWFDRAFAFLNEEPRLCTNPLTWTINGKADASQNLGALPLSPDIRVGFGRIMGSMPVADVGRYKSLPALLPKYSGAECRDGFLMVPKPKDDVFASGWRGNGNLHLHDITLFWANIRQNAMDRVEAYLVAHALPPDIFFDPGRP